MRLSDFFYHHTFYSKHSSTGITLTLWCDGSVNGLPIPFGSQGVPEKKVQCPTVPESPAWALKKRVRIDRKVEEVKPPAPLKAHAAPHFGLPFQPKLQDKTQMDVCPFSFEERECERRLLKEKRLEELRHEEVLP